MFNFYDPHSLCAFKERLQQARQQRHFSQTGFAEALLDDDRSRVANWESKKSKTVPKTQDIPEICKLLDIDPNYLFGLSNINSANDKAISDEIHLSVDNVRSLRTDSRMNKFIDFLMASPKFSQLLDYIYQIDIHMLLSISLEDTFSPQAISKLETAFSCFSQKVLPSDKNVDTFKPYVKEAFPWNKQKESIYDFIHSNIVNPKYYAMLASNPTFLNQTSEERYDGLIFDFAKASYNYLLGNQLSELAKYEVSNIFFNIVQDYGNHILNDIKPILNATPSE